MSIYSWLKQREIGCTGALFSSNCHQRYIPDDVIFMKNVLWKKLYKTSKEVGFESNIGYNGVFSLQYSPNGKLLVAACEKDAVVIIDPLTSKITYKRENVHTMRCNLISFIDDRLFATCSDDSNISIWDVRNMKEEICLLKGHNGWVKNVEYHKPTGKLLSAGFDNQVIAWDINSPLASGSCSSTKVLKCSSLMRMRISGDGQSMFISTAQSADLIAIHNLDIDCLTEDVEQISSSNGDFGRHVCYRNHDLPFDRNDDQLQSAPISRRNHVELYYGYCGDKKDEDVSVLCLAMDVHPENMAVALRYDRLPYYNSKCLSVHNTWSFYNGALRGNNSWPCNEEKHPDMPRNKFPSHLPIARGQPTNIAKDIGPENIEYIQEISFSPCGRLIASPCGYGIGLFAYDQHTSDYGSHIASRLASLHQWEDGSDSVIPSHVNLEPSELYNVAYCFGHCSLVLSTCFSPTHMQVATGSQEGQVVLFEVVL